MEIKRPIIAGANQQFSANVSKLQFSANWHSNEDSFSKVVPRADNFYDDSNPCKSSEV